MLLFEILRRKLNTIKSKARTEYECAVCQAVASVYGIEILEDNAIQCRQRLLDFIAETCRNACASSISEIDSDFFKTIRFLLSKNIVWDDALSYRTVDANPRPIVFSEWTFSDVMVSRTVYCSRKANSEYSVCQFTDKQGNIRYKRLNHTWDNGRCAYCGASQAVYERGDDRETYAYQFIHTKNPQKLFNNMQFDVIIGNPPYQLSDGGAQASAMPIYQLFVEQAKKLNPRYLCMIIPARWFAGGKGLDDFRNIMLKDDRISEIHDFVNASECFPGVEIKGGVCYFLWNIDHHDECVVFSHKGDSIVSHKKRPLLEDGSDTFIRYNEAIDFLHTIRNKKEKTFDTIVSSRKPFGFPSNFRDYQVNETSKNSVFIYAQREQGYIKKE